MATERCRAVVGEHNWCSPQTTSAQRRTPTGVCEPPTAALQLGHLKPHAKRPQWDKPNPDGQPYSAASDQRPGTTDERGIYTRQSGHYADIRMVRTRPSERPAAATPHVVAGANGGGVLVCSAIDDPLYGQLESQKVGLVSRGQSTPSSIYTDTSIGICCMWNSPEFRQRLSYATPKASRIAATCGPTRGFTLFLDCLQQLLGACSGLVERVKRGQKPGP